MAPSVFVSAGNGRFTATELARGPWDPQAQHGGAPAALLMRAFEALPASERLTIARVTYEFMRPVPLGALELRAEVVRPGRRVQLLEASLFSPEGTEVVRARALQVGRVDDGAGSQLERPPAPGPEHGHIDAPRLPLDGMPFFGTDAIEIRFVAGAFNEPGPATAWFRLKVPLVDDQKPSALQRLAAAADFGNGIGAALPWGEWIFINPDLTLYVERVPDGEWVCLDSRTIVPEGGVGLAESLLYDERGRVGRAVQSLLVARRRATSDETP
jgi:Thioesterase-like superfamily